MLGSLKGAGIKGARTSHTANNGEPALRGRNPQAGGKSGQGKTGGGNEMEDEKATYRTLGLETLKIVTTPSGAVEVWFMNRIIVVQPAERVGILAEIQEGE